MECAELTPAKRTIVLTFKLASEQAILKTLNTQQDGQRVAKCYPPRRSMQRAYSMIFSCETKMTIGYKIAVEPTRSSFRSPKR